MRGLIFIFLMMISAPCLAQDKYMQIDLAANRVDITTGFNGTNVVLFGTKSVTDADVVVTLKGPESKMVVRRKGRVGGTWVNTDKMEFRRVPAYYDFASTAAQGELEQYPEILSQGQIGVDYLDFYPEADDEEADVIDSFRDALIRQMQQDGFFPLKSHPVQFSGADFFKAIFELPPGVPTGVYTVEALLVKDNAIIAREAKTLQVGQVGFNAKVYLAAQDYAFFYGVVAVLIAVLSGWSAFTFLRRD